MVLSSRKVSNGVWLIYNTKLKAARSLKLWRCPRSKDKNALLSHPHDREHSLRWHLAIFTNGLYSYELLNWEWLSKYEKHESEYLTGSQDAKSWRQYCPMRNDIKRTGTGEATSSHLSVSECAMDRMAMVVRQIMSSYYPQAITYVAGKGIGDSAMERGSSGKKCLKKNFPAISNAGCSILNMCEEMLQR